MYQQTAVESYMKSKESVQTKHYIRTSDEPPPHSQLDKRGHIVTGQYLHRNN